VERAIGLLLSRRGAWAAALALVGITLAAQLSRLAEPDMAYLLYAAGRVLDGATLYRDVVDIDPPPIFGFNLAIEWVARVTGLSDILLYRLGTGLALGGLLLLVSRLLARHVLADRPTERRYVLLVLCFALFPLSREDFGEREHMVLALLLPYAVVAVGRLRGRRVGTGEAALAGVLAGLALALKPPFGLAWLGIEAWRRLAGRRADFRPSPELTGVLGVGMMYVVAVVVVTPDYPRLVTVLGSAYATYLRIPYSILLLFAPGAPLTAFAVLGAVAVRKSGRDGHARSILAVATIGCFLAGVAQQKGLRYHFYPSLALATVLVAIVAAQGRGDTALSGRLYARVASWLLGAVALVVLGANLLDLAGGGPTDRRRRVELEQLVETVRTHARGGAIGMLSYHMGSAFPLVNYAGVRLASRFPFLWLLPASYWGALSAAEPIRYRAPAEMKQPERMLNQAVREDLVRARPRLLLVLRPFPDQRPYGFRRLNYIEYFGREPELARLFAQYQLIATNGQYDVYQLLDPGVARTAAAPSAIVPPLDTISPGRGVDRPHLLDSELMAGIGAFGLIGAASLLLGRRAAARPRTS
jgi:hypothetical protein